jgi:hypothetical protein
MEKDERPHSTSFGIHVELSEVFSKRGFRLCADVI